MRRYADETTVPISRSRDEIQKLLRHWGADGIRWTDDYQHDRVLLEFVWHHESCGYVARFSLLLPTAAMLRTSSMDGRSHKFSQTKFDKLMAARGKREHRTLLLFLKGAFEAIEEGLVTAEQLFLPFLVGADDRTVSEVLLPRLKTLLSASAAAMLPEHKSER